MLVAAAVARSFESWMSWGTNPLYALLHESIYCQGAASNWAAHRVREQQFSEQFDALAAAQSGEQGRAVGRPWDLGRWLHYCRFMGALQHEYAQ